MKYLRHLKMRWYRWLAVAFEGNIDEVAARYVRRLASENDQWGLVELGVRLGKGCGVSLDENQALKCFRAAAASNGEFQALAELNVGTCFLEGAGVEKDTALAADWFRRSAEKGSPEAQYNYGLALVDGWGGTIDVVEGRKWLVRASTGGIADADLALAKLEERRIDA